MTDVLIGDSAYPPASYPTAFGGIPLQGWFVYIGGNAYHVWTEEEIAALRAQPWCRYIVPCFVRSNPESADPVADADAAIAWARAHGQPSGTVVCWDGETAVNSAYFTAVDRRLQSQAGLHELLYGSKATVIQNARPSGGYDEAAWTGQAYAPADEADQFASFAAYDLGEFNIGPLWDLRAPVTPTPAPGAGSLKEDDVSTTSVSGRAGLAWAAGSRHVFEANYAAAGQPDLVLGVELKLFGGPLYAADFTVSHLTGTGAYEIPAEHIAQCRGVILTVKSGPQDAVFDVCAV
ncbi:MAG TPA: hypothetical protein VGS97_20205 [Actinocrinis sp.]|uniref:hypothetical protein n=1 Tax=Actinocrinis sp. TaxID=1920516 RepID=UPI002DDD7EDA|nr:hypothetical protein [Actinocrinis sp.]HEV2346433.1 hypothetical protein [Actinocrinis sp.]